MAREKGKTVQILYTFFDRRLPEKAWERHLCRLPKESQAKVMRYRRWEDRQARVFGKLLVVEGLKAYGYTANALSMICLDAHGRPFIDYLVDFNLSHSGEYVVCAMSDGSRVGIDIEKRKGICLADVAHCLSPKEKEALKKSEYEISGFYDVWTMKESVSKADGRGLTVPMEQIIIEEDRGRLNMATWFLTKLDFGTEYSCHLSTSIKRPAIATEKFEFQ